MHEHALIGISNNYRLGENPFLTDFYGILCFMTMANSWGVNDRSLPSTSSFFPTEPRFIAVHSQRVATPD